MFKVNVNRGWKNTTHYTNTIMSKNNGALIAFRDENDEMLNEEPSKVIITTNINVETGCSTIIK